MSDRQTIKAIARSASASAEGERPITVSSQDGTVGEGGGNYDAMLKAQAEALNEITGKVLVSGPRARDGVEQALARVEARLAVGEKTVATLEQRIGEKLAGLDVETNALADRLHGLRQRLEKFEEKQTSALAELRLEVFNLAHPKAGEAKMNPAPEPADILPPMEPVREVQGDEDAAVARAITYLDTARKAAIEASLRVADAPAKPKYPVKRFWKKRRWPILATAALVVVWFDAYVFAHYQPAEGAVAVMTRETPKSLSAQEELVRGLRYLKATPSDPRKALPHIERAARGHNAIAESLLGGLYQRGEGVAANMTTAMQWYERAAANGNLKAMITLAKLYAGAGPSPTDFSKASVWFARAAALGDVDAAFDLAILYERGLGVKREIGEAYKWYGIAAASGDNHAASRATALSSQFSPSRQEELNAAIAAFKPAPLDPAANDLGTDAIAANSTP